MKSSSYYDEIVRLINELESAISDDTANPQLLTKLQFRLDTLNARLEKFSDGDSVHHTLLELQALIYGVEGKIEDADKFIIEAMERAGGVEGLSSNFIKNYIYEQTATYEQPKTVAKSIWYQKPLGLIISLVSLALVYGLINLVFVGGQKALNHGDQSKLDALKTSLASEKFALESLDTSLNDKKTYMSLTRAQMDTYKANNQIDAYNALVNPYNNTSSSYKSGIEDYNSRLPAYNAKVEEVNKLSKSIGSTFYIVPVPTGRHSN